MALSKDEEEMIRTIGENMDGFEAPYMAICLYRFQEQTKLSRQLPTEGIQNIAMDAFWDVNNFFSPDDNES